MVENIWRVNLSNLNIFMRKVVSFLCPVVRSCWSNQIHKYFSTYVRRVCVIIELDMNIKQSLNIFLSDKR